MPPKLGFQAWVVTAFAAAALVVMALTATTWKMAMEATESSQAVARTHEVVGAIAQIRADTLQIEINTQSFRISGNPAHLAERNAAITRRKNALDEVKRLTADEPPQQASWDQLREVLDIRLGLSLTIERLRNSHGVDAANAFAASAPLQQTRERVHQILTVMEKHERGALAQRTADQLAAKRLLVILASFASLSLLALLGASFVLIRRQVQEAETSRKALAWSEQSLMKTLQSIGDALLTTDTQGRIVRMNPVAERLTGWTLQEAKGQPLETVFQLVDETTGLPAKVPLEAVISSGTTMEIAENAMLLARGGGQARAVADSVAPIRDSLGTICGVVLVARDVTLTREAQKAVREHNALLEQRVQERTAELVESRDYLSSVINNIPMLIAYVDAGQRCTFSNHKHLGRFAPGHGDITGLTVREILGEQRYAYATPLIAKVMQGEPQRYDWEPVPGVWQVINYIPNRDDHGRVVGFFVIGIDITERKQAEEKIQSLNTDLGLHLDRLERSSRTLRTLSMGNRTMMRAVDEQSLLNSMCRAIVDAGGYPIATVWYLNLDEAKTLRPMAGVGYAQGLTALHRLKTTWADNAQGQGAVAKAVRDGQTQVVSDIQSDPSYAVWRTQLEGIGSGVACPLRVDGDVIGTLAIYSHQAHAMGDDEVALLTELADDLAFGIATLRSRQRQKETLEAVHRLTRYDTLTGLPNEAQFTEFIAAAIKTGEATGQPFTLVQTNLERLNEINDALGFAHGDQLLCNFGARLRATLPPEALVARLRGDEFAALLPGSDAAASMAVIAQVEAALTQPFAIADIQLDVSAKIGIAAFPQHGSTPHDLYRHVDMALNQARKKGLPHLVYDPAQNKDPARRLNVAGELRRAIENGDLMLYLQPKVNMATREVSGAEGLVRWMHPVRGMIGPGEFIELAEHTGLIKPLTEWVIETALRLNHGWQAKGCALPIAVNLSARNLRDDTLLEKIKALKAACDVAEGLLELEITESMLMEDPGFSLQMLTRLRDEGIPLHIDDFGTGYSSLSYLQKLPVSCVKIDQSFIQAMTSSEDSAVIVRSTIDLAHDLGREVVAEGVETQAQWDQLASLGCDYAQGYFIAKPMPAFEFPAWVRNFRP